MKSVSSLFRPDRLLVMSDTQSSGGYLHNTTTYMDFRHSGGANVLFADTHVAWYHLAAYEAGIANATILQDITP